MYSIRADCGTESGGSSGGQIAVDGRTLAAAHPVMPGPASGPGLELVVHPDTGGSMQAVSEQHSELKNSEPDDR